MGKKPTLTQTYSEADILKTAEKIYREKKWFTSRDIYAELVQDRCPRYEERPLTLRRIALVLRRAGAKTIVPLSNGSSRFILPGCEEK